MKGSKNQFSNSVFKPAFFEVLKPQRRETKCKSNAAGKTKALKGATAVFTDIAVSNTLISKTHNKNHIIEVFASRAFTHEIWQFEAQNPGTKTTQK